MYNHLELMIRGAEKSVVIMTTDTGLVRKAEGLRLAFEEIAKRKVKIRIAAPITTKEAKEAAKSLKGLAEVRHTDSKARFCIVDGREVNFMLMDDKEVHPTYDVGIWVNTPFFASALEELFDLAWKAMKKPVLKTSKK